MNTLTTKHYVLDNNIVTLKADKTHRSKSGEINELLVELGNYGKTLPFYAIYPADGSDPIIFEGPITQSKVLAEFERAGPSQRPNEVTSTASRD